ncbi:hypothetical protein HNQ08_001957 [Deinococcus humi]|uniref:Uncharacterized protein n=1 Tax=Deinococcus humi TaxID=662880 RepID=A0A7W8JWC6_9DEIO|nr:hypothetical protein [Deinococcus humi]
MGAEQPHHLQDSRIATDLLIYLRDEPAHRIRRLTGVRGPQPQVSQRGGANAVSGSRLADLDP